MTAAISLQELAVVLALVALIALGAWMVTATMRGNKDSQRK